MKRETWKRPQSSASHLQRKQRARTCQREFAEVCDKELGCMPMAEHREATADGEPESGPDTAASQPSTGEPSAHQSPFSTSAEAQ